MGALDVYRRRFEISQQLAARDKDDKEALHHLAESHMMLGEALWDTRRKEESVAHFTSAWEILDGLVADAPLNADWRADLATALDHLGDVLKDERAWDEAFAKYAAAQDIRIRLADEVSE